jgi:hypothetical protein
MPKYLKLLVFISCLLLSAGCFANDGVGAIFSGIAKLLFNAFLVGLFASFIVISIEYSIFRNQPQSPGKIYTAFRGLFLAIQLPWAMLSAVSTALILVSVVTTSSDIDYFPLLKFSGSLLACGLVNILYEKIVHPESKCFVQF